MTTAREISISLLQDRLDLAGGITRDSRRWQMWSHPVYQRLAEIRQESLNLALGHVRAIIPARPSWRVAR